MIKSFKPRVLAMSLCVALGLSTTHTGAAAATRGAPETVVAAYTAYSAPDAASRIILSSPLARFDQAATAGEHIDASIHRNFPQIIEQNFARLDSGRAQALVDNLGELELSHLAQLYTNASADSNRQGRLLDVLANRLNERRLARLARHFGFAPLYDAVLRVAPSKAGTFAALATTAFAAPQAGAPLLAQVGGTKPLATGTGLGAWYGYTPSEIYLDFRTMPTGALGVQGALLESSFYIGGWLYASYHAGYWMGESFVAPLIQTYAPGLWDDIGGTLDELVDELQQLTAPSGVGLKQSDIGGLFDGSIYGTTTSFNEGLFESEGDYQVAESWHDYPGGGGCTPLSCVKPINEN